MFKNNVGKRIKTLASILFMVAAIGATIVLACNILASVGGIEWIDKAMGIESEVNSSTKSGAEAVLQYCRFGAVYVLSLAAAWAGMLLLAGFGDLIDSLAVLAENSTKNKAQTVAEIKSALEHKDDRGPAFEKDESSRFVKDDKPPKKPLTLDELLKRRANFPDEQPADKADNPEPSANPGDANDSK